MRITGDKFPGSFAAGQCETRLRPACFARYSALSAASTSSSSVLHGVAGNVANPIDTVALSDSLLDALADAIVDRVTRAGATVVRVAAPVMAAMSPVRQPSGIVALAHGRRASLDEALAFAAERGALALGRRGAG